MTVIVACLVRVCGIILGASDFVQPRPLAQNAKEHKAEYSCQDPAASRVRNSALEMPQVVNFLHVIFNSLNL